VNVLRFPLSKRASSKLLPPARRFPRRAVEEQDSHPDQENSMLNELRTQRIALSIEVDRARGWRSSTALDQIKKGLEAKLVALDKEIKAEVEKRG
jgi:hypothetical protein